MDQDQTLAQANWTAAKAVYKRALWARMRQEEKVERLNVKIGEATDGETKKALSGQVKEAKSVLSERKTAEARANKEYRAALKVWDQTRTTRRAEDLNQNTVKVERARKAAIDVKVQEAAPVA